MTKRREGALRNTRTANRSRAMGGIDNDLVAKREKLLKTVPELARHLCFAVLIEVCSPDVADK